MKEEKKDMQDVFIGLVFGMLISAGIFAVVHVLMGAGGQG